MGYLGRMCRDGTTAVAVWRSTNPPSNGWFSVPQTVEFRSGLGADSVLLRSVGLKIAPQAQPLVLDLSELANEADTGPRAYSFYTTTVVTWTTLLDPGETVTFDTNPNVLGARVSDCLVSEDESTLNSLTLDYGATRVITRQELRPDAPYMPNTNIVFRLERLPQHGQLLLSGYVLGVGSSFTLADVDNNLLAYRNAGTLASNTDGFRYSVRGLVRVSTPDPQSMAARGPSEQPAITSDGRKVAFRSSAANLVPGDGNTCGANIMPGTCPDIFLKDMKTSRIERISIGTAESDGPSSAPSIDAFGKNLVFASYASNLTGSDSNDVSDVFLWRPGEVLQRFTSDLGGDADKPALGDIYRTYPSIAFTAGPPSITPTMPSEVRRLTYRGPTYSLTAIESPLDASSSNLSFGYCRLSGIDGVGFTYCDISAFEATAISAGPVSNTAVQPATYFSNIYAVIGLDSDPQLISIAPGNQPANGSSSSPVVASAARLVVFQSEASNLIEGDHNQSSDIFLRDLRSHSTTRVSFSYTGGEADGPSTSPSISGLGQRVAFESTASNLVVDDNNGLGDVFVHDSSSSTNILLSMPISGAAANGPSSDPVISDDGEYVAFASAATNLVGPDENGAMEDVFLAWVGYTADFNIRLPPIWKQFLPSMKKSMWGGLDLVIRQVPSLPLPMTGNQLIELGFVVTNSGVFSTPPGFWVDLYVNPVRPPQGNESWHTLCNPPWPNENCYGGAWYIDRALAPGESITLTTDTLLNDSQYSHWTGRLATDEYRIYAYVDSYGGSDTAGLIPETDENNNRYGPTILTVAPAPAATDGRTDVVPTLRLPRPIRPE